LQRLRKEFALLSVEVRWAICKAFTSHIKGAMAKRGEQRPPKVPAAEGDATSHNGGESGTPFPVHEHVGRRLKEMFDEVTVQPIPDKFLKLLEELEHRQSDGSGSTLPDPAPAKPEPSKGKPGKSK
jgi:hypothetical protein